MQKNSKKPVVGFLILFLLAGALHWVDSAISYVEEDTRGSMTLSALLFCANFAIYDGLILYWFQSVRTRLLPSRARSYLLAAAIMMLTHLTLRAFRYRVAEGALLLRWSWYAYYVPMLLIPTLFLMTALRIRRGEVQDKRDERLLLIPAGLLTALVLTNDLHYLVFVPKVLPLTGDSDSYSYGLSFYLMYGWIILTVLLGTALLTRETGRRQRMKQALIPVGILLLTVLMSALKLLADRAGLHFPYNAPEVHIFGMLAVFESCIRGRLIPYNENYTGFFAKLSLPVLVTDRSLRPAFASAGAISAAKEELSAALREPVYLSETEKLSGKPVRGGYAFWVTDETEVRRANERLSEANELLESENTLIEYENRQKAQTAYVESRHRIYHEIAEQIYPTQKRIEELLNRMQPDAPEFRQQLAGVCVLNAYAKRMTNLLLLSAEAPHIDRSELVLAVTESARYLSLAGLKTSVSAEGETGSPCSARELLALYNAFETLAEQLLPAATMLMVSFPERGIRLAADADICPQAELPGVRILPERDESILYLSVLAGEEAESP